MTQINFYREAAKSAKKDLGVFASWRWVFFIPPGCAVKRMNNSY
jgi:hypothetical protein